MAIAPLFVADLDTLMAKLRLSAAKKDDVPAAVQEALQQVRIGFYSDLGEARVNYLRSIPFNENGITKTDMLRATANSCEVKWVHCLLLDLLPVMFADSSSTQRDEWNQNTFVQQAGRQEANNSKVFRESVCSGVLPLLQALADLQDTEIAGINATAFGNSPPCDRDASCVTKAPNTLSLHTARTPFDTVRRPDFLPSAGRAF